MPRCLVVTLATALSLPSVASARREPSPTDAGAPMPVAPAAPVAVAPVTVAPAATPVVTTPAAASTIATPAPLPAPVLVVAPVAPARPMGPPPPPPRIKDGNTLIAAGLTSVGVFYFFTSLGGAVIVDKVRDRGGTDPYTGEKREIDTRRLNYGRALIVPVVGPFIGLAYTSSAKERWAAALSGTVQVTGVVLAMAGFVAKARARRAQRYSVGANVGAGTAMLSLGGRF